MVYGRVRARASLKPALAPDVVAAQHGWWQAWRELDLPGYPLTGDTAANLNSAVGAEHADPANGSTPLRSYLCEMRRSDRVALLEDPCSARAISVWKRCVVVSWNGENRPPS